MLHQVQYPFLARPGKQLRSPLIDVGDLHDKLDHPLAAYCNPENADRGWLIQSVKLTALMSESLFTAENTISSFKFQ